jgi:hypothetical protein
MSKLENGFDRAAEVVADFGSPFYAEERQRDVWNEASALGFQAMLWGTLGLACVLAWIGGRPLIGAAIALLAVIGVASWLTVLYANRRGVTGRENVRLKQPRTFVAGAIYLATLVGLVVRSDVEVSTSAIVGGVVGLAIAAAAAAAALVQRRPSGQAESPEESGD